MTQGNIYLDFNATTPVDPRVKTKVLEWVDLWGNPSSIHQQGRGAKKLLRESRRGLAKTLGCHPLELVFTSGGSEANNMALKGSAIAIRNKDAKRKKIILGGIEHPAVLKQRDQLVEWGFEVVIVPVSFEVGYDLEFYRGQLDETVALVSIMYANNEVGLIAPLSEMIAAAHEVGAIFHSDLVQALGKIPFDLSELNVDLASFSSHKIYALKGAGILYIKKGTPIEAMTHGGAQERRRRAGTENLMAIAAMATMVDVLEPEVFQKSVGQLRDHMEASIRKSLPEVKFLFQDKERLSNTSSMLIPGVSGESMLMNLDIRGFSVGTGAACSSGNPEPSPVLLALGLTRDEAQSSLRISLGKDTTLEQVDAFVETLVSVVHHLRQLQAEGVMENGEVG